MPAKLDRCVEEVKNDPNVDNPFAVCQAAINKSGKGFKTLSECVQANIGTEKDPVGYCQMKFPKLQNNAEDLATAKMLVAITPNVSIVDKKRKKKTDIHLLLNTPLEGLNAKADDLDLQTKALKLKIAAEDFEESKHPRDESGEFTSSGGGKGGTKKEKKKTKEKGEKLSGDKITKVRNFIMRRVDPDETGDLSGFSDSDTEQAALIFNISQKDALEIFESDGAPDRNIFELPESEEEKGLGRALESEKADIRDSQKIADNISTDNLDLDRFKNLSRAGNPKEIQRVIAEERTIIAINKMDEGFSDRVDQAITEQEEIDSNSEALKGMSKTEKKVVQDFLKKNPKRRGRTKLSEESETTLKKLNDVSGMLLDRANQKKREGKLAMAGLQTATLKTGSLVDAFNGPAGEKFVTYFLLNANENLKGWGVTPSSIPRHIGSFKDMPFVVTSNKFFAKSPYGEDYDHPDTRHFAKLGITRPRSRNDMMQQALFQEEFRVGNIDEIFNKGDDWFAFIRILPKFADMEMPPLVSPAIFQLNEAEAENHITQWIGMHLTGLDEKPAYGNDALFKGSCFGDKNTCLKQLTAKNIEPCFRGKLANVAVEFAKAKLKIAAQISSDTLAIQAKPLLCRKDGKLQACPQSELKRGQVKAVVIGKKERRSSY